MFPTNLPTGRQGHKGHKEIYFVCSVSFVHSCGVGFIYMKNLLFTLFILNCTASYSQSLPVEIMSGHKRTGVDVLWFKNFSANKNKTSPWLFFHRSRASADYHNKTAFGVTNAVSYNLKNGIGFVAATQFLQQGFVPKFGVQYFKPVKNGSFFNWVVAGNNSFNNFSADWFVLVRWQPKINEKLKWFLQGELLSSLDDAEIKNLTQRIRAGISRSHWQFGFAADCNETGKNDLSVTNNIGGFLRREF